MKSKAKAPIWSAFLLVCCHSAIEMQAADYVSTMTNTPGLLGYWRFDSAAPTNSVVNGWTGTNVNDATIGSPGSGCPLAGYPNNQALLLPGNGGYLASDLLGGVTNEFTLIAWINMSSYPGTGANDPYFEIIDQETFADDCDLITFPDGTIHFYTDAGGLDDVATPNPIPLNEWHFIVGTSTNHGPRRIYVDGQLVGANIAGPHSASPNSPVWIGEGAVFNPRHFVGAIDEAAIFDRALTTAEIVTLYIASGPPNIGTQQSIRLITPVRMRIGSLQASVALIYSSGTNLDVTGLATYNSSDTNVLTVSPGGLITAHQLGSATVTATYSNFNASETISVVTPTASLTHRYSFSTGNANDSVGSANGTLHGSAGFSGGGLNLDGNGYVSLPAGIIDSNYYALSIEIWATVQGTPDGTVNVISAFGSPTGGYFRLGTHDSGGDGNAWIGGSDSPSGQVAGTDSNAEILGVRPGPVIGNVHLVAVWDPAAGHEEFYVNGDLANGSDFSASLASMGLSAVANIGANLDGTDGIVATISEYRIYSGSLTLDKIRTSLAAGPAKLALVSGQINAGPITNVTVTTHPNFIVGTIQDPVMMASSATVQNINLTTLSNVTFVSGNTNILVVLPNNQVKAVGLGTTTLTATYQGTNGQTSLTIVSAPPLLLTHRYSFVSGASDSVGGENGALMGFASANGGLILNTNTDGSFGDYLELPRDLLGGYPAFTVEAWVDLGTQSNRETRVWDSGNWNRGNGLVGPTMLLSPNFGGLNGGQPPGGLCLYATPQSSAHPPAFMLLPADAAGNTITLQSAGLVHLVAVLDNQNQQRGILYYEGQLAGTMGLPYSLSQFDVEHVLIGKSLSLNDPSLIGTIKELRFYYGSMTAGQAASNHLAGLATVGVNQGAARITDPPLPQSVLSGERALFSVGVIGAPPLNYQWFKGAQVIPGATTAVYSIPNASDSDNGAYSVQVSNLLSAGVPVVSAPANLTVDCAVNLTNGLLVHLTFDNTYDDTSGNGNNGAAGGSPVFIPGKIGSGAIHLNTAPPAFNYVSIPNSTGFSFATNFSVAFWLRYTGFPNDLPMVGNAINSTYNSGWILTDDFGRLEASLKGSGFMLFDPAPVPIINDGAWHHIAMMIDAGDGIVEFYVDGSKAFYHPLASVGELILGDLTTGNLVNLGQDPTGTYGTTGEYDIDDFVLWSRVLYSGDVSAIYRLGQAGQSLINGYVPETLSVGHTGSGLQINWNCGILLSAPSVSGPWTPVPGATTPTYQFTPSSTTNQFFRVQHSGGGTLP